MPELIDAGTIFFKGLFIGFSIAAPVGPIGILCIQRTLSNGFKAGMLTGAGAASADALYGFIGAFGLVFISRYMVEHQQIMQIAGGVFLCYLGISILLKYPSTSAASVKKGWSEYLSTFLLTLANPVTILMFIAVFAGLGITGGGYAAASLTVAGIFSGSLLWWFLLSLIVTLFRAKVTPYQLRWVNRGSGVILMLFGVYALAAG